MVNYRAPGTNARPETEGCGIARRVGIQESSDSMMEAGFPSEQLFDCSHQQDIAVAEVDPKYGPSGQIHGGGIYPVHSYSLEFD